MKTYNFIKNVRGALTITLDSYDFSLSTRTFTMGPQVNQIIIPEPYALGLFTTTNALDQYKLGYFTIKEIKELTENATSHGIYVEGEEEVYKAMSSAEITSAVRVCNKKVINKILEQRNPVEIANLVLAVRENIDTLPSNVIKDVEDVCGVELRIE